MENSIKMPPFFTQCLISFCLFNSCFANQNVHHNNSDLIYYVNLETIDDLRSILIKTETIPINISQCDGKRIEFRIIPKSTLNNCNIPKPKIKKSNTTISLSLEGCTFQGKINYEKIKMINVSIPKSYKRCLTVKSRSGNVSIKKISMQNLTINTTLGDVELLDNRINERLTVKTTKGNKVISGIAKDLVVKSTIGDLNSTCIAETNFIKSTVGNAFITLKKETSMLSAISTKGNVNVMISDNIVPIIKVKTVSGKINSEYLKKIGEGKNNIAIKTVAGNIDIKNSSIK